MTTLRIIAAAALLTATVAAAPASAQSRPRQIFVPSHDLNLAAPADAAVMLGRITTAAGRVCRPDLGGRVLQARNAGARCRADTLEAAVRELAAPAVTALHREGRAPVLLARK